jgi:hypothetical protein
VLENMLQETYKWHGSRGSSMSEHISSMFKGLTSSIVKKKSLNDTKRLFTNQINNRIQNLWVWSHVAIQSEKERERERERERDGNTHSEVGWDSCAFAFSPHFSLKSLNYEARVFLQAPEISALDRDAFD